MLSWNRTLKISLILFIATLVRNSCAAEEELFIQQWGLASTNRVDDYDPESGHLLTRHQASAVLWDVKTGLALRHYPFSTRNFSARFVQNGRVLLKSSEMVRLLNKQSGEVIRDIDLVKYKYSNYSNILLINDGQPIFVASCGPEMIRVWNLETGETLNEFPTEGEISAAKLSPDQQLLLAGSGSIGILWNLKTGKVQQRFCAPSTIHTVEFNDDGSKFLTLVSGEFWYTPRVIVWETATVLPLLSIPRTAIYADFVNDDILLNYPQGGVELWPLDRHEKAPPKEEWPTYRSSRDNRWWVTKNHWRLHVDSKQRTIRLHGPLPDSGTIDIPTPTSLFAAANHLPLAFSASGRWLLTGKSGWGFPGEPSAIWDLEQGELKYHLKNIKYGSFHPTEDKVLLSENELKIMDLASGEVLQSLQREEGDSYFEGKFTSAQFSKDGKHMLISVGDWYDGNGGGILIWNLQTGEIERDHARSGKAVMYAGWNSDESKIVAALTSGDEGSAGVNEITVIDAKSGESLQTRMFPKPGIGVGGVDPSGNLISATSYKLIRNGLPANGSTMQHTTSLLAIDDLEQSRADLPGQHPFLNMNGRIAGYIPNRGKLSFFELEQHKTLYSRATSFSEFSTLLFHPGQLLIAGSLRNPHEPTGMVSYSVGFEQTLTGDLEAELFLFYGSEDWLIKTKSGFVNGSPGGLRRLTRRVPGTLQVSHGADFTDSITKPKAVSETLSQSLPNDLNLNAELQKLPQQDIPKLAPSPKGKPQKYGELRKRRKEISEKLKAAGAKIKQAQFRGVTYIHLEGRPVTDDLIKKLRWSGRIDRLYLADTGITDQQLDGIGILKYVKRMSLWGNPITDAGLSELTAMWSLEVLDIYDTKITAVGLNQLRMLPSLKTLIIPASINVDELAPLKTQLPDLEILLRKKSDLEPIQ
ncbi:WD40 repeat domain-containing protein [uncultured Gimesia sp.]|uniref:WD40 repeat domain-containing protein n=1 Tax=uncultured Gimesia sp. TaxID=1678688 RepID=UPI002616FD27|nr:WD40 repeat domain-containing protein [uncultured Gimesia sp.]